MTSEDAPVLTKTQMYANQLYDLLDREAVNVDVGDKTLRVWKGAITKACGSVGIPDGVYKRITDRLTAIGSIQLVEQGRRNLPSTIVLLGPPTAERWTEEISPERLTERPEPATMLAEIKSLRQKVGGVDWIELAKNHEERLLKLESQISRLTRKIESEGHGKKTQ